MKIPISCEIMCVHLFVLFFSCINAADIFKNETQHTTATESTIQVTTANIKRIKNEDNMGVTEDNFDSGTVSPLSVRISSEAGLHTKKVPLILLQKFNPQDIIRPVQEKWKEFHNLLTYPFHPNYGGLVLLNPQHFWSKLKEKGNILFGGAHNSIFGISHSHLEYPFPYRKTKNMIL